MQIIIRTQSGKSDYVTMDNNHSLLFLLCKYLSLSEEQFKKHYKIIFKGKIIKEPYQIENITEGSTILLLRKQRENILSYHLPQNNDLDKLFSSDNLNIYSLINQYTKKYTKPDIVIHLDENKVNMLMEMGFPEVRVRKALILRDSNTDEALNWILQHSNDDDIDVPLTQKELRELTKERTTFIPDDKKLNDLIEMGFTRELSLQALKFSKNSFSGALSYLTDEPQVEEPNFNNPQFARIIQQVMSNPETLSEYMNHPEIGPLLLDFIQQIRE